MFDGLVGGSNRVLWDDEQSERPTHSQEKNLPYYDKLAAEGCVPSARLAKGIRHYMKVNSLLEEPVENLLCNVDKLGNQVVLELAAAVQIDTRIPEWVSERLKTVTLISKMVMQRLPETERSDLDKAAHICGVYFGTLSGNFKACLAVIEGSMRKYPDDEYFYFTKACVLAFLQRFREALKVSIIGLEKYPNSIDLLYTKASSMKSPCTKTRPQDHVKAHEDFLNATHRSDRHVPEFCFELVSEYAGVLKKLKRQPQNRAEFTRLFKLIKDTFKRGQEAVEHILLFNQGDEEKVIIWRLVAGTAIKNIRNNEAVYFKKIANEDCIKSKPLNEKRKAQLSDSSRVDRILSHRQHFSTQKTEEDLEKAMADVEINEKMPKPEEPEVGVKKLKTIELVEMNQTEEFIYAGRIIEVTSIEPPVVSGSSVILVVEDIDGDTTKCVIETLREPKIMKNRNTELGVGCKFNILNPHMKITCGEQASKPYIWVSNENLIRHPIRRKKNMCRYCGTDKAEMQCAKCQVAFYCDRDCQLNDWKILKHKLICSN